MALYGKTNEILADINSKILQHDDLCKFLYYTDAQNANEDILSKEKVDTNKILNKRYFVYRRIPNVIKEAGAYMSIDFYKPAPWRIGGYVDEIYFNIDLLIHIDCLSTIHGNRAFCIMEALDRALYEYIKGSIGNIDVVRVDPILGLEKNFIGYSIKYRAFGFNAGLGKVKR